MSHCRAYFVMCVYRGCGSLFLREAIGTHLTEVCTQPLIIYRYGAEYLGQDLGAVHASRSVDPIHVHSSFQSIRITQRQEFLKRARHISSWNHNRLPLAPSLSNSFKKADAETIVPRLALCVCTSLLSHLQHHARDGAIPPYRCPMTMYSGCHYTAKSRPQLSTHVQVCRERLVAAEKTITVPATHCMCIHDLDESAEFSARSITLAAVTTWA
jgi:hypothetical protein